MLHANETGISSSHLGFSIGSCVPLPFTFTFQLVLLKLFKSELFSILPKVDPVINSCKGLNSSIYPTDVNLRSGFFFSEEKGKKERLIHLLSGLSALIKVSGPGNLAFAEGGRVLASSFR